jgi:hypothetical protein
MNIAMIASVLCVGLLAQTTLGQSFSGQVDSKSSSAGLGTTAGLNSTGFLIGDYDPVDNPGGTQTRPGLFGGSGNNQIAASASFDAGADLQSQPAGSVLIEADFGAMTLRLDGLFLDLLNGTAGGADVSVTLEFSTFNTVSPSFIYPGGIPITVPLGEVASITRAELLQTGPSDGVLTPTADPDVFDLVAVIAGEANLTLAVGLPGTVPVPNDVDALPLVLPISGQVERLGDGSLRVSVGGSATAESLDMPVDTGPLPAIPLELPTLGAATAGVLLNLTPQTLSFEASLDLGLVIHADPAVCTADWNKDGLLNFFDLVGFIASFNAQDPRADLAAPTGAWNFFDVSAYLALFNAGCP